MTGSKHRFDPDTDVPNLGGKVYVVTAGSAGIGYDVAARLLQHNAARIYLLGASDDELAEAVAGLRAYGDPGRVELVRADLADLRQTDGVARALAARLGDGGRLDGLLLLPGGPAGAADGGDGGGPGYAETRDGLERQMQVHGFAAFRLARALLPALAATDGSRLVAQASARHRRARGGTVAFDSSVAEVNEDLGAAALHARAALAPLLLVRALARRKARGALGLAPGGPPRLLATHPGDAVADPPDRPGTARTALGKLGVAALRPFLRDPRREGARAMLFAATSPAVAAADDFADGCYIGPDGRAADVGKLARDDELGERLWRLTEEILREKLK